MLQGPPELAAQEEETSQGARPTSPKILLLPVAKAALAKGTVLSWEEAFRRCGAKTGIAPSIT